MPYGLSFFRSGSPDDEIFIGPAVNTSQLLGSKVSFTDGRPGWTVHDLTIFSVIIFIPLVWGKCEFKVYSDDETEKYAGKEVGICIANHRYTNDWILDFIAAEQYRNVFKFGPWRIVHFDCLFKRSL